MASKLQTLTIKNLESNGYFVINLTRTNKNGIADLLALKENEKPIFIECKEKGDTLKPLQAYHIGNLFVQEINHKKQAEK